MMTTETIRHTYRKRYHRRHSTCKRRLRRRSAKFLTMLLPCEMASRASVFGRKKNSITHKMVHRLPIIQGIPSSQRLSVLKMLAEYHNDFMVARDIEACIHSMSKSLGMHMDKAQQIIYNLHSNPELEKAGVNIVCMNDAEMAKGTIVEDIEKETLNQRLRFEQILQEKYDKVNTSCRTVLRCRRCGSGDVSAEQKQTRGADEAMTVFCTCAKCNNRWTMR